MKPSFSVQITHLVLDLYDFGTRQSKQIMKIIHSFLSLVHLRIVYGDEDSDLSSNITTTPNTAVSLGVPPPKYLKELVIYSHIPTEIPRFVQLLLLWLRESQTRISTLTCSVLLIEDLDDTITTPIPLARYLTFLGPAPQISVTYIQ